MVNGMYIIELMIGWNLVVGIVSYIFYLYVKFEGGVNMVVVLEFMQMEIWQEQLVFIGNGLIKMLLFVVNLVIMDVFFVDVIMVKYLICLVYYEMVSQLGVVVVKIMENVNYNGQLGIWWDGLMNFGFKVFQVDVVGMGGWDLCGFVIIGFEQMMNFFGCVDMQFVYGINGLKIICQYGMEIISQQGIYWDFLVVCFCIGGMFNIIYFVNDMFCMDWFGFQNGIYLYGVVIICRYYLVFCLNGGFSFIISLIYQFFSGIEGGFQYVFSVGVIEVFYIVMCGIL